MLVFQFESEVLRIERDGARDIPDLITNAMKTLDELVSFCVSKFDCLSHVSLLSFFLGLDQLPIGCTLSKTTQREQTWPVVLGRLNLPCRLASVRWDEAAISFDEEARPQCLMASYVCRCPRESTKDYT